MKCRAKTIITAYRRDMRFWADATLVINLIINSAYAVFETVCSCFLQSVWMGTLAFYYIALTLIRFYIFHRRRRESQNYKWKIYRSCAVMMFALTIALALIHILTTYKGHTIRYKGYIIYAVAAYTFYALSCTVRNVIIYRKINDPIISASKMLNLSVAAISIYSLQSAMITAFGDSESFRILMGNCVGIGAFVIIIAISVFMITRANREMKKNV